VGKRDKAPEEELRRLWRVEFLQLEVAIGTAVNCSSRRWHGWGNSGELQSGETEQRQRRKTKGNSRGLVCNLRKL
jgi:hypothetical protein